MVAISLLSHHGPTLIHTHTHSQREAEVRWSGTARVSNSSRKKRAPGLSTA